MLGVNTYTVTRWVNNETEPRASTLKRLPDAFPSPYSEQLRELIQAEFFPYILSSKSPTVTRSQDEMPCEYLVRTLAAYATTSGPFRAWTLRANTLQRTIELFDPDAFGAEMTVVQCVPPLQRASVRSLCKRMGVGTAPWNYNGAAWRFLFLGAESLAGWTVGCGEPGVVRDMEQHGPLAVRLSAHEKSAVAWPLQREGKVAGCLLVSSTQVNYFTQAHLNLIEVCANMLALSFRDEEFYELHRIALHEMPLLSEKCQYTSVTQFRDRVLRLRREQGYRLSELEAEALALQQMEAELLDMSNE
jgi:transcriptional regulator with XRE-family HTH domain